MGFICNNFRYYLGDNGGLALGMLNKIKKVSENTVIGGALYSHGTSSGGSDGYLSVLSRLFYHFLKPSFPLFYSSWNVMLAEASKNLLDPPPWQPQRHWWRLSIGWFEVLKGLTGQLNHHINTILISIMIQRNVLLS